ncbi:MAG: glutaminyl-peptide cyclotransferase [Gemmatimonadota bacterium]
MKKAALPPFFALLALIACDQGAQPIGYQILRTLPHDSLAYTQGLVFHNGFFYESTGSYGKSTVRKVDPESGRIIQATPLSDDHFGEGLALVGSELYQLTWKAGLAFVYDLDSLKLQRTFEFDGEGWGLCFDGEALFMSDGSNRLTRRDPVTFEVLDEIRVTEGGFSVSQLNELECIGDHIFANVFMTTRIVRIQKNTGRVSGELNGFNLSAAARRRANPDAVMNGIAYDPARDVFFLTGKYWQDLFEVRISGL